MMMIARALAHTDRLAASPPRLLPSWFGHSAAHQTVDEKPAIRARAFQPAPIEPEEGAQS